MQVEDDLDLHVKMQIEQAGVELYQAQVGWEFGCLSVYRNLVCTTLILY